MPIALRDSYRVLDERGKKLGVALVNPREGQPPAPCSE